MDAPLKLPIALRLSLSGPPEVDDTPRARQRAESLAGARGALVLGGARIADAELKHHPGKNLYYAEVLPPGILADEGTFAESPIIFDILFGAADLPADEPLPGEHGAVIDITPFYPGDSGESVRYAGVALAIQGRLVSRGELLLLGDRYGFRVTGEVPDGERYIPLERPPEGMRRAVLALASKTLSVKEYPFLKDGDFVVMDSKVGDPATLRFDDGTVLRGELTCHDRWRFRLLASFEEIGKARIREKLRAAERGEKAPDGPEIIVESPFAVTGTDHGSPDPHEAGEDGRREREARLIAVLSGILSRDEPEPEDPSFEDADVSIYDSARIIVLRDVTPAAVATCESLKGREKYTLRLFDPDSSLIFQCAGQLPWITRLHCARNPLEMSGPALDLSPLSYFRELKELKLANVTLAGLPALGEIPGLESFAAEACVSDEPGRPLDVGPLGSCPSLRRVAFIDTRITGQGQALADLPLEELVFWKSGIDEIDFLHGMETCRRLVLGDEPFTEAGALAALTHAEELRLVFCDRIANPDDFLALKELRKLKVLQLEHCNVTDLHFLKNLSRLEYLHLGGNGGITDIAPVAGCRRLYELNLQNTSIEDITPLAALDHLEALNLACTPCADFSILSKLRWLKELDCTYTSFSDYGPIAKLEKLGDLRLYWNTLGDLAPLRGLPALRDLHLGLCGLTAVPEGLAGFDGLSYLNIAGNDIPEGEIEALREALPACTVEAEYHETDSYHAYDAPPDDGDAISRFAADADELEMSDNATSGEKTGQEWITWMAEKDYFSFLDAAKREAVPPGPSPEFTKDNLLALGLLLRRLCRRASEGFSFDAEALAKRDADSVFIDAARLRLARLGPARDSLAPDAALVVIRPRPLPGYAFLAMEPSFIRDMTLHVAGRDTAGDGGVMDEGAVLSNEDLFIMLPFYMREAWGDLLPLRPLLCLAADRTILDDAPHDAPAALVEIAVKMGEARGSALLIIPTAALALIIPILDREYVKGERPMPGDIRDFFESHGDTEDGLTAEGDTEALTEEEKDALLAAIDTGPAESGPDPMTAFDAVESAAPSQAERDIPAKDLSKEEIDALLSGVDDPQADGPGGTAGDDAGTGDLPPPADPDEILESALAMVEEELQAKGGRPLETAPESDMTQEELDDLLDVAPGRGDAGPVQPSGGGPLSMAQIDELLAVEDEPDEKTAEAGPASRLHDRLGEFLEYAVCSGDELGECVAYGEYLMELALQSAREGTLGTEELLRKDARRHPPSVRTGLAMALDGVDPAVVDRFMEISLYTGGRRGAALCLRLMGIAFLGRIPFGSASCAELAQSLASVLGEKEGLRLLEKIPAADRAAARYFAKNTRQAPLSVSPVCADIEEMIGKFDARSLEKLVTGLMETSPETIVNAVRLFTAHMARSTIESVRDESTRLAFVKALLEEAPSIQACIDAQEALASYIRETADFAWIADPTKEMPW